MQFDTSALHFTILPHEEGVNPPVTKPNPMFLTDITEQGMRALFTRFYEILATSPIHSMFPQDPESMQDSAQVSADFFIQICGGTPYFAQRHGAPQMRKRHAPFPITPESRLHWLSAFEEALQPIIIEKASTVECIQSFWEYINVFSLWMINRSS